MRICLITPSHLSMNPRLVKEADALAHAGHDVSVICGWYSFLGARMDEAFATRPWTVAERVPFGPHLASKTSYFAQSASTRAAKGLFSGGASSTAVAAVAHAPVVPGLRRAALRQPADLYVAHYVAALPAASDAARRHGAPYAFDAEDFHLGDLPDTPANVLDKAIIRTIEAAYLPGCVYVTAASPGIAEAYTQEYELEPPSVVLNVFPKSHAPSGPTPKGGASPGPSLYWFSRTIGSNRGLGCAVRAIGLAHTKPHLYLRGEPAPGYVDRLRRLAGEVGASDRLHILEPAPPHELERLAARHDLGLVGEVGLTRNRRIALTNKQFSYLLAGVPAVMSDVAAHRRFAKDAEGAVTLFEADNPRSLAAGLDFLLSDPARLALARRRAYELGQERFNWEIERTNLVACVAGACSLERQASGSLRYGYDQVVEHET